MNKEQVEKNLLEERVEKVLEKLHLEIDFASKSFENKSLEFNNTLNKSVSKLQATLEEIKSFAEQSKIQHQEQESALQSYALLKEIVPQIASEVEKIHSEKVEGINKKFEKLHDIIF
ncbi:MULTISPECIES: hypothetical protein [unclassified Candidatus Tisiphia]|uniref:hypothetical protein n=1 Tax=unclassified Candidatus Tisiphia TaxID=2996318 RepID=UPI00312C797F